ncbi:nucleotide-sugar transporter, DMT family [Galdieria sulphuraria]|uniref:Nucleotide-sugar transporter, DMT family n=1 Tax=Galdieria sulphuraria TaxID=130081 RepID=M2W822_GALSU|nr:nucleotide-sugar transporter, DMT family [Galdieria sulphuraria]EME32001.1 nucleotide-sugar transporter, DMT family [Galdieria sulphuraria]|eukprot:XP_005708521.1 nucleotide-sugar transporter, DMT family [Galdieria sulphuraria]
MLTLEILLNKDSGLGDWITFLQVSTVVLLSLRKRFRWRRKIPLAATLFCSFLYYMSSSLNTWSLQYGISVPLYIVFRSSSLLTTFLCSLVFQRKPVYFWETLFVLFTSCGLFLVSWAAGANSVQETLNLRKLDSVKGLFCILLGSFLSPLLSIVQEEVLNRQEDKAEASEELLFYMQLFSLTGYVLQAKQLFSLTRGWLLSQRQERSQHLTILLLNVLTQVFCIRSVFAMSAQINAVALQMALSVRKLLSLLLSYYVFNHRLTRSYWIGALMTFLAFPFLVTGGCLNRSFALTSP